MKGSDCMTVTIAVERNAAVEVTCEWERNCYHARVYENWGGEWHQTHESNPYSLKEDAMKSYKRFIKRYIK